MNCDTTSTVLRQVSRGAWSHVTDGQSRSCLTSPDVTKRAHAVATTVTPFTPLILTRCLVSPRSRRTLLVAVLGMAGAGLVALGWWRDSSPALERFPVWGLDVSHHQGVIDWARVTEDRRLRFVFIKATEGGDFRDRRFAENWAAAKRAGLRVGAYHFFTFCTDPVLQARNFLGVVPNEPDALPPAIDLEFAGNCQLRRTAAEVRADVTAVAEALARATGKRPILYLTSQAAWAFEREGDLHLPRWVRSLGREPTEHHWLFWQLANQEQVDGIIGPVDLNVFAGDEEALERL